MVKNSKCILQWEYLDLPSVVYNDCACIIKWFFFPEYGVQAPTTLLSTYDTPWRRFLLNLAHAVHLSWLLVTHPLSSSTLSASSVYHLYIIWERGKIILSFKALGLLFSLCHLNLLGNYYLDLWLFKATVKVNGVSAKLYCNNMLRNKLTKVMPIYIIKKQSLFKFYSKVLFLTV